MRADIHEHRAPRRRATIGAMVLLVTASAASAPVALPTVSAEVTPGCVVDLAGMLAWWRGEDTMAAEVGPELLSPGAVDFDGGIVGQAPVLGADTDLSTLDLPAMTTGLTVEMWVKPTDLGFSGANQALATRWDFPSQDDSARTFSLMLDPSNNLMFETDETSTRRPVELRAPVPQITDGSFHHIAATWDATSVHLYVDAALVAAAPSQGGALNAALTTPLRLGAKSGIGPPFRFDGIIDEASVWDRALTASEIGAIQNAGSAGKCTFVPVEQAKLTAAAAAPNDRFGTSVGVNADTVVVGAPFASGFGQFTGTAYVYTGTGSTWTEQAALVADDAAVGDRTGWTVDVEGDTIVAGSYGNNAAGVDSGAAYVFSRSGTAWTQQAKLVPADAATFDGLGYSVAIDGDTAVVASVSDDVVGTDSGSAYVFTRSGTTWTEQAKLVAGDGAAGDNFGFWLDIDGDTVVVGAPGHDAANATNAGAAYVFTRSGTTWAQQQKLTAPDGTANDQFGHGVTIDGDTIGIGVPFDDDAGTDSGSALVFSRSAATWTQEAKFRGADTAAGDRFGSAVATNGSVLVVGSPRDGIAGNISGSAYVFSRAGIAWSENTKLVPADNQTGDQFGISVAISGDVIVGAHNDDGAGNNSGSAYVFAP